jgi:FkbH-like protein
VVILAAQTSEVVPALWDKFADMDGEAVNTSVERTVETYRQLIQTFRSRSQAHLIVHTLQAPPSPSHGILDAQSPSGQSAAFARMNAGVAAAARESRNVYVLDYNALVARRGADHWRDEKKWLTVRLPVAGPELHHLAREWLRFLHPLTGRVCKALAVDLDNTLWGGVVGEDGIEGIKVGDDYAGGGYRALQRAMLDLYRRGVLLAVCSKNNSPEALEALARHPGMLLRPEHFAAVRINWADKAQNLRELARELNIGLDAIAFLDDNPVEREWVQSQAPEVTVIDLPADPLEYARALRDVPYFERLSLSDEDRARGQFYAEQRQRADLQQAAGSIEDFYRSLEMEVDVEPVTAKTIARAAQLTQKTNQFNMTTRRYTEEQLAGLAPPAWRQYAVRVRDRFGDNGIVGLAMVRRDGAVAELDTLLLSCRVIGRTVETALLSVVAADAASAGARKLVGRFIPTKKNAPAKDVYRAHGFRQVSEKDGESVWALPLPAGSPACPPWIKLSVGQGI